MRFNIWYDDEIEEGNVDVGVLLHYLGDLDFDKDVLVNVTFKEVAK